MKNNPILFSIPATLIFCGLLGYLSIEYLAEYGIVVFCLIPFMIGFLPTFLTSLFKPVTRNTSYKIGFLSLAIAILGMLVFAFEGMICITMAMPVIAILTFVGAYVAYLLQKDKVPNSTNTIIILSTLSLASMGFDVVSKTTKLYPVKTTIIVNAPIERVWNNVVTFSKIDEPTEWLFKTGIAYPTDATIKGSGVGAIRYCNFTTGSFVEPITTWNEPNLLQFDVTEHPIPMHELNPFGDPHPPHLDGYFRSEKGQFQLTKINEQQTQLEGTTWYRLDIAPQIYWKIWSNFIVHKIHRRVLNHIKQEAEIAQMTFSTDFKNATKSKTSCSVNVFNNPSGIKDCGVTSLD